MAVASEDPPPSSATLPASMGNLAARMLTIPAHQACLNLDFPGTSFVDLFPLHGIKFIA